MFIHQKKCWFSYARVCQTERFYQAKLYHGRLYAQDCFLLDVLFAISQDPTAIGLPVFSQEETDHVMYILRCTCPLRRSRSKADCFPLKKLECRSLLIFFISFTIFPRPVIPLVSFLFLFFIIIIIFRVLLFRSFCFGFGLSLRLFLSGQTLGKLIMRNGDVGKSKKTRTTPKWLVPTIPLDAEILLRGYSRQKIFPEIFQVFIDFVFGTRASGAVSPQRARQPRTVLLALSMSSSAACQQRLRLEEWQDDRWQSVAWQ